MRKLAGFCVLAVAFTVCFLPSLAPGHDDSEADAFRQRRCQELIDAGELAKKMRADIADLKALKFDGAKVAGLDDDMAKKLLNSGRDLMVHRKTESLDYLLLNWFTAGKRP